MQTTTTIREYVYFSLLRCRKRFDSVCSFLILCWYVCNSMDKLYLACIKDQSYVDAGWTTASSPHQLPKFVGTIAGLLPRRRANSCCEFVSSVGLSKRFDHGWWQSRWPKIKERFLSSFAMDRLSAPWTLLRFSLICLAQWKNIMTTDS